MRVEAESLILFFCSLECLNYWRVGGGGVSHMILFRASSECIFSVSDFENRGLGDGSD